MSVIVVIQARMSSSRFPGKVLCKIGGVPMIDRVVNAVIQSGLPYVVATSLDTSDDPLVEHLRTAGFPFHRGPLDDVKARVLGASEGYDRIVRITADCPFVNWADIKYLAAFSESSGVDYVTNTMPPTFPDGRDIEVVKRSALEHPGDPLLNEHVTAFIRFRPDLFSILNHSNNSDESRFSLTVDDPDDIPALERWMVSGEMPQKPRNLGFVNTFHRYMNRVPAPDTSLSRAFIEKAKCVIPGGAQTFSRMSHRWCDGFGPAVFSKRNGPYTYDLDGNEYLDMVQGLGSHIMPDVSLSQISNPTLPSTHELELAEMLVSLYPGADMVRFFKNGSDATAAAVRLARHCTGKKTIWSYGYHGWSDVFCVPESFGAMSSGSIGHDIRHFSSYDELEDSLDDMSGVAGVIIEPANQLVPSSGFIHDLRNACTLNGTLLIFDEVVTFPRVSLGGCAGKYGVRPDLATLGKGMANGAALSALVGDRDFMSRFTETFISTTFGGEVSAIKRCIDTLRAITVSNYPEHCSELGKMVKDDFNNMAIQFRMTDMVECVGLDEWPIITFRGDDPMPRFTLFQQECLRRGVLFNGSHFFTTDMNRCHIWVLINCYREALMILKAAVGFGILNHTLCCPVNTGGIRKA